MNKAISLIVLIFCSFHLSIAQDLYIPRNVIKAYEKGTRSKTGYPGTKYWQNHAKYDIQITVLPPNRTIHGTEEITYFNNSTDTITKPVLKLLMNIHKPGAARLKEAPTDYLTSGIHIDNLTEDGENIPWNEPESHITWQNFSLPKPLLPKDSVKLKIDWHYDMSLKSNREGLLDSTTYFIAYFYPRVAVYDDIDGWDNMNFFDIQEFYNDFNDYKLSVKVPKNYIVWATGTLQNASEVLQKPYLDKLNASMKSDEIIHIATLDDLKSKNITTQNETNTWVWTADNISDMTCTVSNQYVWDASSVVADKTTQRRVSVQAVFDDTAKDFHQMVSYGRHAVEWLSEQWPGLPYPYPKTTIVQGLADMEYPMMVNDHSFEDFGFGRMVLGHEIAHTWFPFYMGTNENRYGFMDEGWATTFQYLISREYFGNEKADEMFVSRRIEPWINNSSSELDLPIITPSNMLIGPGYKANQYGKASLGYLALKDLLGDDLFKKCLHEYMRRWHGKHPIPWDFFYTFNDTAKENLNWFWTSWFFSNYYIDMAIEKVEKDKKAYTLTLKNIGGFPVPLNVKITYKDGSNETLHQSPRLWQKNPKQAILNIKTNKQIQKIALDGGIFLDADVSNNVWKK